MNGPSDFNLILNNSGTFSSFIQEIDIDLEWLNTSHSLESTDEPEVYVVNDPQ